MVEWDGQMESETETDQSGSAMRLRKEGTTHDLMLADLDVDGGLIRG